MDAAAQWLTEHGPLLLTIARHAGVAPDAVEDVAQEASLRIWRRWETWHNEGKARAAWAITITKHCAIDWHRRLAIEQRGVLRCGVNDNTQDAEALALLALTLAEYWRQLTPLERWVTAAHVAGYDYREQGAALGLSVLALKGRQTRQYRRTRAWVR